MLSSLLRRRRPGGWAATERDVREELRLHLQARIEDNLAAGMSEDQARADAERRLGNFEALVRRATEIRMSDPGRDPLELSASRSRARRLLGDQPMSDLIQDIRFGVRTLTQSPAFTFVAIASLALGIGFNTAMFTLIDAVLFKPAGVGEPDGLVRLHDVVQGAPRMMMSYPDHEDLRDRTEVFSGVAMQRNELITMSRDGLAEFVLGESVTTNLFDVLQVRPLLGRTFAPDEGDTPGEGFVVMIGERFWRDRFGGDREILGREILLGGHAYTVIGVVPRTYVGNSPPLASAFWVPITVSELLGTSDAIRGGLESRGSRNGQVVARLADGVTLEQAREQVRSLGAALASEFPDTNEERGMDALPFADVRVNPAVDGMLLPAAGVLMGVVGLVLLIACANVANMMLARASVRRQEIAVRLAIGAGRGRLVRQLLTESTLLSVVGGAVALLMAWAALGLMLDLQPATGFPVRFAIGISPRVLAFTGFVSVLTGMIFGLVPALQSTRPDLSAALKSDEAARDGQTRGSRLRGALVAVQVAVSLILLVSATLLARSLVSAQSIDPGIATESIVGLGTGLPFQGYAPEEARQFHLAAMERIAAIPGVDRVAFAERIPLDSSTTLGEPVYPEGQTLEPGQIALEPGVVAVSPGYFDLFQIGIVQGRAFDTTDVDGAPPVAIVNAVLAEQSWPGESPIGKRFALGSPDGPMFEIVGVNAPHKIATLGEEPSAYAYVPYAQYAGTGFGTLIAHIVGEPAPMIQQMRLEVQELDANLAILDAKTLSEYVALGLLPVRMSAMALGVLGTIGAILAAIGVYGVVAFAVARRTREIGIRMAVGADRARVVRMVVAQGMRTVGIGIGVGIVLSLLLTRALTAVLYGVSPTDVFSFGSAALGLLLVGAVANLIPALRAAGVNPVTALRTQ